MSNQPSKKKVHFIFPNGFALCGDPEQEEDNYIRLPGDKAEASKIVLRPDFCSGCWCVWLSLPSETEKPLSVRDL